GGCGRELISGARKDQDTTGTDTSPSTPDTATGPLALTADKFITYDDILVSIVRVHNSSDEPRSIQVVPILDWTWSGEIELRREYAHENAQAEANGQGSLVSIWFRADARLHDSDVRRSFRYAMMSDPAA